VNDRRHTVLGGARFLVRWGVVKPVELWRRREFHLVDFRIEVEVILPRKDNCGFVLAKKVLTRTLQFNVQGR
jgi:hypothetical protein